MQVFILGVTGTIGTVIVEELVNRNHQVLALSRSDKSDELLISAGVTPFRSDLTEPGYRADTAVSSDVIVQIAATFGNDIGDAGTTEQRATRSQWNTDHLTRYIHFLDGYARANATRRA